MADQKAGELYWTLSTRGMEQVRAGAQNMAREWSNTDKIMQGLIQGIGLGFGTSIVGAIAAAGRSIKSFATDTMRAAIEIEDGFLRIQKVVNMTESQFSDFKRDFIEMGRGMAIPFSELQAGGAIAGQVGVRGSENIRNITKLSGMLATTSDLGVEAATLFMARTTNIFQRSIKDADQLASVLTALGNNFEATESEIETTVRQMAGMAATFGLTAEQTMALAAAMKSVGINAEVGGTTMVNVMGKMLQSTKEFAEQLGMTESELKNLIDRDPMKALRSVFDKLAIGDKWQRMQFAEGVGLDEARRQMNVILRLSQANDKLTKAMEIADAAAESRNATEKEYAVRATGAAAQTQILNNQIELMKNEISSKLLPAYKELLKAQMAGVDFVRAITSTGIPEDQPQTLAGVIAEINQGPRKTLSMSLEEQNALFDFWEAFQKTAKTAADRRRLLGGMSKEEQDLLLSGMTAESAIQKAKVGRLERGGASDESIARQVAIAGDRLLGLMQTAQAIKDVRGGAKGMLDTTLGFKLPALEDIGKGIMDGFINAPGQKLGQMGAQMAEGFNEAAKKQAAARESFIGDIAGSFLQQFSKDAQPFQSQTMDATSYYNMLSQGALSGPDKTIKDIHELVKDKLEDIKDFHKTVQEIKKIMDDGGIVVPIS